MQNVVIQLDRKMFKDGDDTFMTCIAHNAQETRALVEVGFDYVCQKDDLTFLRKRK